jgi:hypothetical protein
MGMKLKNKPGSQKKADQKKRKREERKKVVYQREAWREEIATAIDKQDLWAASAPSNSKKQDLVGRVTGRKTDSFEVQILKNVKEFSGLSFSEKLNYLRKAHPGSEVKCFVQRHRHIVVEISPGPTCPMGKDFLFSEYEQEVVTVGRVLDLVSEVGVEAAVAELITMGPMESMLDPEAALRLVTAAKLVTEEGLGIEAAIVALEKL